MVRCPRWAFVAAVLAIAAGRPAAAQKGKPALAAVLSAAAAYVVHYSEHLQAVGADELFTQMDTSGQLQHIVRLNADAAFVGLGDGHFGSFRDVYAIDTKPLHERVPRLLRLFEQPPAQAGGAVHYARQFTEESAVRYLHTDLHMLDAALAPLELLRADYQPHMAFKLDSTKTSNGVTVAVVRFSENNTPSLLRTPDGLALTGRFWIEAASGGVTETEMVASDRTSLLRSVVIYSFDKSLEIWLPKELSQRFDISHLGSNGATGPREHESFDTHAYYSNFRQVPIDLDRIR